MEILSLLDKSRQANDPDNLPLWHSDTYSRIEMDLTSVEKQLPGKIATGLFHFLNEYKDTLEATGESYIPILISETTATRHHSVSPSVDKEVITGNRISGMEAENVLRKYTGSMLLKGNFYRNNVNFYNIEIPSPASANSQAFYNYTLLDSLTVDGRPTYRIGFGPRKLVTSPVFSGQMDIDAGDFGIRSVTASLDSVSNVNWIRNLIIRSDYRRVDSKWFYDRENLTLDIAISAMNDKIVVASLLGNRVVTYSLPDTESPVPENVASSGESSIVSPESGERDAAFWAENRPMDFSAREDRIFEMVDRVKNTGLFKGGLVVGGILTTGYYENKRIGLGIGPYDRLVSTNKMEGTRIQVGARTLKEFNPRLRLTGYAAYGTEDRKFKGKATLEYVFRRDMTRKLTVGAKYDLQQLGKGAGSISENNIFNSILAPSAFNKRSFCRDLWAEYEHENNSFLSSTVKVQSQTIFGNENVPLVTRAGTVVPSVTSNNISYTARFAWDETVNRGYFDKSHLYTRFPIITLQVTAAIKDITSDDWSYIRPEARLDWNIPLGSFGSGSMSLNAGTIIGDVPYPFLKLHEGNKTYYLDKTAFACMDYYEFASDRWITAFYEHNFGGFFLGKIPLIKKMDLREIVSVRAAWGTISDRNNANARILLPAGTKTLETPYVEVGAGLGNIFRLIRVDCFWRLTNKGERNFAFNVGLGIEF